MTVGRVVAGLVALTLAVGAFSAIALLVDRRWGSRAVAGLAGACCLALALMAALDPARRQPDIWLAFAALGIIAFVAPAAAMARVRHRKLTWSMSTRWFVAIGASYFAIVAGLSAVALAALITRAFHVLVG